MLTESEQSSSTLEDFTGKNSHKVTELTELHPSVNALVQMKATINNSITGLPSLDLWFTDNMISFLGRRICGKAV